MPVPAADVGNDIGILEEVQVLPGLGLGVVDRAGGLVPLGAGKAALREVEVQVQPARRGLELVDAVWRLSNRPACV